MLELLEDRDAALSALSSAYFARLSLSPSELAEALPGWRFVALVKSGQTVGAVAVKGDEGHIGIIPAWRGKWGGRRSLLELCAHFGVTKTSVSHNNPKSMRWLERCGWKRVGCTEYGVNYAI